MASRLYVFALLAFFTSACGTKANPDFCCIGADDCAQVGVNEDLPCAQGLSCVNNDCVRTSCETEGCPVEQPVCNVVSGVCEGCDGAEDCTANAAMPVCNVDSGVCVGCVTDADCAGTTPICDDSRCGGCSDDSDCESGACGDDGACIAEADIAYVASTGTDTASCSKTAPCATIQFAGQTLSGSRRHIVVFPGDYTEGPFLSGGADLPSMVLHGGGATLACECGDGLINASLTLEIRNLALTNSAGVIGSFDNPTTLRNVRVRGRVLNRGDMTILDSYFSGGSDVSLDNRGAATVTRTQFVGGISAIRAAAGSSTSLENVLIQATREVGIDADIGATGTISFSTISSTGSESADVRGIRCRSLGSFSVLSSIVWTPQEPALPSLVNCDAEGSIVGPVPYIGDGNLSSNPMFVNPAAGDLHISEVSPAIDKADVGPEVDFGGDTRPKGARFDLGAYEAR